MRHFDATRFELAFPNTATFFMSGHAYAYVRDQRRWACLPRSG
jgi:hypothetical protein